MRLEDGSMPAAARSVRLVCALILVVLATPAAGAGNAHAAIQIINVTTTDDTENLESDVCQDANGNCSLRGALETFNSLDIPDGNTLIVDASEVTGTISIGDSGQDDPLSVSQPSAAASLTVVGPNTGTLTIDAEHDTYGMEVSGDDVAMQDLTIANGIGSFSLTDKGGGGIFMSSGTLSLQNMTFLGNDAGSGNDGGAIFQDEGTLNVTSSTFTGNTADGSGGAIGQDSGALNVNTSSFVQNVAQNGSGGAIAQIYQSNDYQLSLVGSTLSQNSGYYGGGLYLVDTASISFTSIEQNSARAGGGIYADPEGSEQLTLSDVSVSGNEVANETPSVGGGLYSSTDATISDSSFTQNTATGANAAGAGVYFEAEFSDTTFDMSNSTVAENRLEGGGSAGAGLAIIDGEGSVSNSTVAYNSGADSGGGLWVDVDIDSGPGPTITSTVIGDNSAGSGGGNDCFAGSGDITSGGNNLVGSTTDCNWPGGGSGDQTNVQTELGQLGNYGGTGQTIPPLDAASSIINAGSNPDALTFDQRGEDRPVPTGPANTDIGAYELQAPVNYVAPYIEPSSDLELGDQLICQPGEWATDDVSPDFSYEWLRNGSPIGSGPGYTLQMADVDQQVTCNVNADNGAVGIEEESQPVVLSSGEPQLLPASLDFGDELVGDTTAHQSLTVKNIGNANLTVDSASSDEQQFGVDDSNCEGQVLAPDAECTIEVWFSPTAAASQNATLTVDTNDGDPTAQLEGTGIQPVFAVAPASLDFGSQQIDSGASAPQTLTVTNTGTADLTVYALAIHGGASAQFQIAGASECTAGPIEIGEECEVDVTFTPTSAGNFSSAVRFVHDGPSSPTDVAVSGVGVPPPPPPSPTPDPPAPGPSPAPPGPELELTRKQAKATVGRNGKITLPVTCKSSAGEPCQSKIRIYRKSGAGKKARRVTLAKWAGELGPDRSGRARLVLTLPGRKALKEQPRVRAWLSISTVDPSGGSDTVMRRISLVRAR